MQVSVTIEYSVHDLFKPTTEQEKEDFYDDELNELYLAFRDTPFRTWDVKDIHIVEE